MTATNRPLLIQYYYCFVVMTEAKNKWEKCQQMLSVYRLVCNINRCEMQSQSQSKSVSQNNGGDTKCVSGVDVGAGVSRPLHVIRCDRLIFLKHSVLHFCNWIVICHFLRIVILDCSKQTHTRMHHMRFALFHCVITDGRRNKDILLMHLAQSNARENKLMESPMFNAIDWFCLWLPFSLFLHVHASRNFYAFFLVMLL